MPTPPAIGAPMLVCVDPARVPEVWPHVAQLIAQAMRRGRLGDAADVVRKLRSGAALLWLVWDGAKVLAAVVTELAALGGEKVCTIVACGGRGLARFRHLVGGLERYAAAEGCTRMCICGRRGWARALPGYRIERVIIGKAL